MEFALETSVFSRYEQFVTGLLYMGIFISLALEFRNNSKNKKALKDAPQCFLLQNSNDENRIASLHLLEDIKNLKQKIEDDRARYKEELISLQEQLEKQKCSVQNMKKMEERLQLVEAELQRALTRAKAAKDKLKAPALPPTPPPPPPLPLEPLSQPLALKRRSKKAIGMPDSLSFKKPVAPGVNEEIINAIKEGKFTLRVRTKENNSNDKEGTQNEVSEILNTLGSLRRAPKKRQSQFMEDTSYNNNNNNNNC